MKTFDKNIKKKLYNAEMPVPDGIWATIESQIPVKKEKPKFWFLFLLIAFAIPYFMLSTQTGVDQPTLAQLEEQRSSLDQAKLIADNKTTSSQTGSNIHKGSVSQTNRADSDIELNKNLNSSAKSSVNGNSKNFLLRNKMSPANNKNLIAKNAIKTINKGLNKSNFRTNDINSPASLTNGYTTYNSYNKSNTSSITSSSKKLKFINNPIQKTNQNKTGVFKLIEKSRIYKAANQITQVANLVKSDARGVSYNHEEIMANYVSRFSDRRATAALCPSFNRINSGFYIYSDLIFGYSSQKLSTSIVEQKNHLAYRAAREKSAFSVSANIGIGKTWSNGMLLETGLNYDKININSGEYNNDKSHSTLVIKIDSTMTTSGWVTKIDSTYENNEDEYSDLNSFTQINFPLAIGYEMPLNDGLSIVAKTGVLFNITSSNKGTLVDKEGNSYIYNSSNPETTLFRTNLGLSFLGSLSLQGEITPLLLAYAGINVNYYPSNFSLSTNPIQQTYMKAGLTTGLKYRL